MNLKQLKYVQVLAEQGSFSKAAEELNISQPSLSQYIRKIESELGIELFDRTGNNVRLTDAGYEYTKAGREILDIDRKLMLKFTDIREEKTGTIIIGVSPHRSMCILPKAVAEFHKVYPGIRIVIDERVGQELLERAEKGEYDICIATAPVDLRKFDAVELFRDESILIVPEGSEIDKKLGRAATAADDREYPAVDIKCIDRESIISVSESQLMQKILEGISAEYGIGFVTPVVCKSLGGVLGMVRAGIGAALVPTSLVKYDRSGINCYSILQDIPGRDIVAVLRKDRVSTKATDCMLDILKKL